MSVKKGLMLMGQKIPGKNGFKYRPQFGVIVTCADETEQEKIYTALRAQGLACKVVAV